MMKANSYPYQLFSGMLLGSLVDLFDLYVIYLILLHKQLCLVVIIYYVYDFIKIFRNVTHS